MASVIIFDLFVNRRCKDESIEIYEKLIFSKSYSWNDLTFGEY